MGLRIQSDAVAQSALWEMRRAARAETFNHLATGSRINRASDDPSGLVISEKLYFQIRGLEQAIENTQNDINMIRTAEAALGEISDVLVDLRSTVIFALNTATAGAEELGAAQQSVDRALEAIDRIAASTRFSDRNLLNGESSFVTETRTRGVQGALHDLDVRKMSFAPEADRREFAVDVSALAERAAVLFTHEFRSGDVIAKAETGVVSTDAASLRVSGAKGSEVIELGAGATVQDFVHAVNASAAATGVYASSFQALPIDSTFRELSLTGTQGSIQVEAGGGYLLGVQVGGGAVENVAVSDSDADGIITRADLQTALQTADNGLYVDLDDKGDIRVFHASADFKLTAAHGARTFTLSHADLAAAFDPTLNGGAGDLDGVGIDLTGDGTADITVNTAGFVFTGGVDTSAELAELQGEIRAALDAGGYTEVALQLDGAGLTFLDATGALLGSASSQAGILDAGAGDDVVRGATAAVRTLGGLTDGLLAYGLSPDGGSSHRRAVEFASIAVSDAYINDRGELAISTMAVGGTLSFVVSDPDSGPFSDPVPVTAFDGDGDGYISLRDINVALNGPVLAGANNFEGRNMFEAYFTREEGLTIVYNNNQPTTGDADPHFTISEFPLSTDLATVTGRSTWVSRSNVERLALFSTDFGSDQVISIEDVTAPVSGVRLISGVQGGLVHSSQGDRHGLGLFHADGATLHELRNSGVESAGRDVQGTINGEAFAGHGFDITYTRAGTDIRLSLGDTWGQFGSIGERAEAGRFGLATFVRSGLTAAPLLAGDEKLSDGVIERLRFTVYRSRPGENAKESALRFQIRETNAASDSLMVGIRSALSGALGLDRAAESDDVSSAQRANTFLGGKLSTLRTGGRNALAVDPHNALEVVDSALDQLGALRGFLGSLVSDTLQHNLDAATATNVNLTSSRSDIVDIDYAATVSLYTKETVLNQARISVLSAANADRARVLDLLGQLSG